MADFCKTCSISLFGEDHGDLADILPPDAYTDVIGAGVLCECCGYIVVNAKGERMSTDFEPSCTCGETRQ